MLTPYFPAFRSRLASLGRRTAQTVRQTTLAQLQEHLRDFLPAPLLSAEEGSLLPVHFPPENQESNQKG